jgi:pimeloyl-ACP methyl ester carboxylesterase
MKTPLCLFALAFTAAVALTLPAARAADAPPRFYSSFDGVKIHYEVAGKGRAVLLLHGFSGTADSWRDTKLYGDLLTAGFTVVTMDLRGNGLSDKPTDEASYQNDAEAKDLMGLTKSLHLAKYDVVGYSRGSIIAARLLVLDPRAARVVFGGMGSAFTDPAWPRRRQFVAVLEGQPDPQYDWVVKLIKDRGLDLHVQALIQKGQPSTSPAELATVNKPVLVICGDKDEDNGSSEDLAKMIPRAKYVRVPGDHPGTWMTQPFATDIVAFLKH